MFDQCECHHWAACAIGWLNRGVAFLVDARLDAFLFDAVHGEGEYGENRKADGQRDSHLLPHIETFVRVYTFLCCDRHRQMAENEERSDEFHHYDVFVSSSENSRLCPNDDRIDSSKSVRLVRRSDFVYQLLTKIDHTDLRRLTVTL